MKSQKEKKKGSAVLTKESFWENNFNSIFYSILSAAGVFYAIINFQYRTGLYNDDALYVITSKDFWNTVTLHPMLVIKPDYPMPGLPLLLLPFSKLFQPHWFVLEWVTVAMTLVGCFLLGKWTRKWLSAEEALSVVALVALNPLVVRFSGIVMPACYFMTTAVACFYLLDGTLKSPSFSRALLLGFLMGWGSLLHPESVLISASILFVLLFSREGRKIIFPILIPLTGWALFFLLWFRHRYVGGTEYGGDLKGLLSHWQQSITPAFVFFLNWSTSILQASSGVFNLQEQPSQSRFGFIFLITSIIASVIGFIRLRTNKKTNHTVLLGFVCFALLYIGVHTFWLIPDARYVVPLIPLFIILLVSAGHHQPWRKFALGFLLVGTLIENGIALRQTIFFQNVLEGPPWKCLAWIQENTPADAKIMSNIFPSVDLYTGRQAGPFLNLFNVDMLQYILMDRGYTHILLRKGIATASGLDGTGNPNLVWDRYRRWVERYPDRFPMVYKGISGFTKVYKVVYDPKLYHAYEKFISATRDSAKQNYAAAYTEIKAALTLAPNLGSAFNLLGVLDFMTGKPDLAEKNFLKANELLPDSPNAIVNLATLRYIQGQEQEALHLLKEGQEINRLNGNENQLHYKLQHFPSRWVTKDYELLIDLLPENT